MDSACSARDPSAEKPSNSFEKMVDSDVVAFLRHPNSPVPQDPFCLREEHVILITDMNDQKSMIRGSAVDKSLAPVAPGLSSRNRFGHFA